MSNLRRAIIEQFVAPRLDQRMLNPNPIGPASSFSKDPLPTAPGFKVPPADPIGNFMKDNDLVPDTSKSVVVPGTEPNKWLNKYTPAANHPSMRTAITEAIKSRQELSETRQMVKEIVSMRVEEVKSSGSDASTSSDTVTVNPQKKEKKNKSSKENNNASMG
jgi:hypothetical protein